MRKPSKRFQEAARRVTPHKTYRIQEALELLKECPPVKFDQTVELSLKLGVDTRKADQQVRGTVSLPHGTGKSLTIVALVRSDRVEEAKAAGADYAGEADLIERIQGGWVEFDSLVTTPEMMREVGKLGKVLGPRGLMPTPKAGTVTNDIVSAIQEIKAGKVEYRAVNGVMNNAVGKLSFEMDALHANILAFLQAIMRAKPAAAKGQYMQGVALSATMSPGFRIDLAEVPTS